MKRLRVFEEVTVLELVPFEELVGSSKGVQHLKAVRDQWAMPGGGVKSLDEVLQCAKDENLSIQITR